MKIPTDASPGLQAALKDLDERLTRLGSSSANTGNLNLKGQRATNAGKAEAMADYVTLAQALDLVKSAVEEQVPAVIAKERTAFVERFAAAARGAAAPAAVGDVPTWLATILTTLR